MPLSELYAPSPGSIEFNNLSLKVAASTVLWGGGMLQTNAGGFAVPASDTAANSDVCGRALVRGGHSVDNATGSNGDKSVTAEVSGGHKAFVLDNSVGAPCVQATMSGAGTVYVEDDHTVAASSVHSKIAGRMIGFLKNNAGIDDTSKVLVVFPI